MPLKLLTHMVWRGSCKELWQWSEPDRARKDCLSFLRVLSPGEKMICAEEREAFRVFSKYKSLMVITIFAGKSELSNVRAVKNLCENSG